jgi:DNA-binding MarR family transcriptional regulator
MTKRQHAVKSSAPDRRTPAGDAFSRLAIQLIRLGGLLGAAGDALARPAGQTSARWQVLAAAEHGPATVAGIARALGLARQSVQRVADLLAQEGLVAYDDNPEHLRAKLIRLLPPGQVALTRIQAAQRQWADRLGGEIGVDDLTLASGVLDRVIAALD